MAAAPDLSAKFTPRPQRLIVRLIWSLVRFHRRGTLIDGCRYGDQERTHRQATVARRRVFAPFQLDQNLLDEASPQALVMHCLPAHRGEEISAEVLEGERSVVWDEAENRMHVQKALIEFLLDV